MTSLVRQEPPGTLCGKWATENKFWEKQNKRNNDAKAIAELDHLFYREASETQQQLPLLHDVLLSIQAFSLFLT